MGHMKPRASEDTARVPVAPNVSPGNGWGLQFLPVLSQECYRASYWLWSLRGSELSSASVSHLHSLMTEGVGHTSCVC